MKLIIICAVQLIFFSCMNAMAEPSDSRSDLQLTKQYSEQCPNLNVDPEIRKSYAKLPPAQKKALLSQFENMGENDEPPFPIDGISKIDEEITQALVYINDDGEFDIGVNVNSNGVPESVSIYKIPSEQLRPLIANLFIKQKYKPALCNCVPCRQEFPFHYTYTLTPVNGFR